MFRTIETHNLFLARSFVNLNDTGAEANGQCGMLQLSNTTCSLLDEERSWSTRYDCILYSQAYNTMTSAVEYTLTWNSGGLRQVLLNKTMLLYASFLWLVYRLRIFLLILGWSYFFPSCSFPSCFLFLAFLPSCHLCFFAFFVPSFSDFNVRFTSTTDNVGLI